MKPKSGKKHINSFEDPPSRGEVQHEIDQIQKRCVRATKTLESLVKRYSQVPKSVRNGERVPAELRIFCHAFLEDGENISCEIMYSGMIEVLLADLADAEVALKEGDSESARQLMTNDACILDGIVKQVSLLSQAVKAHERELKRIAKQV